MLVSILSILVSSLGFVGTIKMNQCMMLIHSFFFCSVIGAFYAYLCIDSVIRTEEASTSFSDRTIMFLLTLPFFFIFLIGCHSIYLLNMYMDEMKERKEERLIRG